MIPTISIVLEKDAKDRPVAIALRDAIAGEVKRISGEPVRVRRDDGLPLESEIDRITMGVARAADGVAAAHRLEMIVPADIDATLRQHTFRIRPSKGAPQWLVDAWDEAFPG